MAHTIWYYILFSLKLLASLHNRCDNFSYITFFFFLELELQMELWNGILGAVVGMSCSLNLFFKIKSLRVTERIQQCA